MSNTLEAIFECHCDDARSALSLAHHCTELAPECEQVSEAYWRDRRGCRLSTFIAREKDAVEHDLSNGIAVGFNGPGDCTLYVTKRVCWIETPVKWNSALAHPDVLAACIRLAERGSSHLQSPFIIYHDNGSLTWDDAAASSGLRDMRRRLSMRGTEVRTSEALIDEQGASFLAGPERW